MNNFKTKTGIVLLDTETSFMKLADFSLKNSGFISPDNIIEDWSMYCVAWKFLDVKKTYSACVNSNDIKNDKEIVSMVREVLEDTKLLIGHNLDKFDLKKFNTRLIYHKLPPINHKILTLDTLKVARKHFAFTSNRLDYLARFLGIGHKMPHVEGNPWLKLINGVEVEKTLKHMTDYCKYDVDPLLEGVYLRMRPYIDHPKLSGPIKDGCEVYCQHCGSNDLQRRGDRVSKAGIFSTQYQCKERHCMGWTSTKEKETTELQVKWGMKK
jgi:hypothetical protein